MEEQKYCYFQFKYLCNLCEGEEVRVVGSIEELGNWDIKKSELNFKEKRRGKTQLFSSRIDAVGRVQHGSCLSGSFAHTTKVRLFLLTPG